MASDREGPDAQLSPTAKLILVLARQCCPDGAFTEPEMRRLLAAWEAVHGEPTDAKVRAQAARLPYCEPPDWLVAPAVRGEGEGGE